MRVLTDRTSEILDSRERRYNRILALINEYDRPVLCAKINYPGTDKNTPEAAFAFDRLYQAVLETYSGMVLYRQIIEGADGKSYTAVLEMDGRHAKKIGIEIEERHRLGRVFDIDIYSAGGIPIDRNEMKKETRSCIVCGKNAWECMRRRSHDLAFVTAAINRYITEQGG